MCDIVKRLASAIAEEFDEDEVNEITEEKIEEARDLIMDLINKRKERVGAIGYAKNVFNKAVSDDTLKSLVLMFTEDDLEGGPMKYKCIFHPDDDDWDNILELFRAARNSIRGMKWLIVKSYEDIEKEDKE